MSVKKYSPLFTGLLLLALLVPLASSSLAQQAGTARAPRVAAPSAPVTTPTVVLEGGSAGDTLGRSMASAGDINGDGYADLIAGAPLADLVGDPTLTDAGSAQIYYGSSTGLSPAPALTLTGAQSGEQYGLSVAGIGDVNGDGYADVAVAGVYYDDGANIDAGRVDVYLGTAAGLSPTPAFEVTGQPSSLFGLALGGGDVNADGFSDLVVGAPGWDNGEVDEGAVFVYYGSGTGPSTSGAATLEINQAGARFGQSVAVGDTDGDGAADVVAGAPMYSNGQPNEGAAFLFAGGAGGVATTPGWTFECDQDQAQCGAAVAAGDINGDGLADVFVGAPQYTGPSGQTGRVTYFMGASGGLPATGTPLDGGRRHWQVSARRSPS